MTYVGSAIPPTTDDARSGAHHMRTSPGNMGLQRTLFGLALGCLVALAGMGPWNFFHARRLPSEAPVLGGPSEPRGYGEAALWGLCAFAFIAAGVVLAGVLLVSGPRARVAQTWRIVPAAARFVVGGVLGAVGFYVAPAVAGSTRDWVSARTSDETVVEVVLVACWGGVLLVPAVLLAWTVLREPALSFTGALFSVVPAWLVIVIPVLLVLALPGNPDQYTDIRGAVAAVALRVTAYGTLLRLCWPLICEPERDRELEASPPALTPSPRSLKTVTLWSGEPQRMRPYVDRVEAALHLDATGASSFSMSSYQPAVNRAIRASDLVICLIEDSLGIYLRRELQTAIQAPRAPKIQIYKLRTGTTAIDKTVAELGDWFPAAHHPYVQGFSDAEELGQQVTEFVGRWRGYRPGSNTAPEDRHLRVPERWRQPTDDWARHLNFEQVLDMIEHQELRCAALYGWGGNTDESSLNAALLTPALRWLEQEPNGPRLLIAQAVFLPMLRSRSLPENAMVIVAAHNQRNGESTEEFAESLHYLLARGNLNVDHLELFVANPHRARVKASMTAVDFGSTFFRYPRFGQPAIVKSHWQLGSSPGHRMWRTVLRMFPAVTARLGTTPGNKLPGSSMAVLGPPLIQE